MILCDILVFIDPHRQIHGEKARDLQHHADHVLRPA